MRSAVDPFTVPLMALVRRVPIWAPGVPEHHRTGLPCCCDRCCASRERFWEQQARRQGRTLIR